MRRFTRSLYGRISGLFLILLLVLCLICGWVILRHFNLFVQEVEQKFNHDLARHLADELAPILRDGPDPPALEQAVSRITTINPALELYVLDAQGRILSSFQNAGHLQRDRVSVAPIRAFLSDTPKLPILGDDPCHGDAHKVFSAVPVSLGANAEGYLYVILRGTPLETTASSLRESYILDALGINLLLTLAFVLVIGVMLFALVTRRFRKLAVLVCRFKEGNYAHRVDVGGDDEVGQLGKAFNEMAATIEAQVEALRQTDALRRELVANVSHDLRTPLTSTRGYAERMIQKNETLSPDERQHYLEAILDNTTRLSRLIEQLSELARLDALQVTPRFEPFPIAELAQDMIVKFEPEAQKLGVTLKAAFGPRLPVVCADIGLVEQALSNLIDNALHNTPEGGTARIEIEEQPGRVCVRVSDTGYGIAPDEIALVTQRFYRSTRTQPPRYNGSGLGLAIVKEITDLHGSPLALESAETVGTTVSFYLSTGETTMS